MATRTYNVGITPPQVVWTVVRGDTASFKVYVTDDAKEPLNIPDWEIKMDIERNGVDIVVLYPEADADDEPGEFTVSLTSEESELLETDDVFDIQLTDPVRVWTVAQGKMFIIEDVTESGAS
jgi:hypothetical protein